MGDQLAKFNEQIRSNIAFLLVAVLVLMWKVYQHHLQLKELSSEGAFMGVPGPSRRFQENSQPSLFPSSSFNNQNEPFSSKEPPVFYAPGDAREIRNSRARGKPHGTEGGINRSYYNSGEVDDNGNVIYLPCANPQDRTSPDGMGCIPGSSESMYGGDVDKNFIGTIEPLALEDRVYGNM